MTDPFTPSQRDALFNEIWEHIHPTSGRAAVRCPNDGYKIDARLQKEEGYRADLTVNCPKCGMIFWSADLDPRLAEFREWTDDEKQEMVDRHFQGLPIRCPVDGTKISPSPSSDRVMLHCWRCGKVHWGDAHHRIGTRPLRVGIEGDDVAFEGTPLMETISALLAAADASSRLPDRGLGLEVHVEKRYQIFVSSTFEDLKEERHAVQQALLALDCIPSGMELFPASDDDQWTVIKRVIDECDYYLLVIGGRYGSVGDDGIGYTEKEFDYAVRAGKPVVSFLHGSPDTIPLGKTDRSDDLGKKLEVFRAKAKRKMVRFWNGPAELKGEVSLSLPKLFKEHPAEGWVRARYASGPEEIDVLRRRVEELEAQLAAESNDTEAKPGLSSEALLLLAEAAGSKSGRILANSDMDGLEIQAGGFLFREGDDRRQSVRYEEAVASLSEEGFIREVGEGTYELTGAGYDYVDRRK